MIALMKKLKKKRTRMSSVKIMRSEMEA